MTAFAEGTGADSLLRSSWNIEKEKERKRKQEEASKDEQREETRRIDRFERSPKKLLRLRSGLINDFSIHRRFDVYAFFIFSFSLFFLSFFFLLYIVFSSLFGKLDRVSKMTKDELVETRSGNAEKKWSNAIKALLRGISVSRWILLAFLSTIRYDTVRLKLGAVHVYLRVR